MALRVSFGRPYASRICSIFPLWIESKAFVKLTNNIVARRFFAGMPSTEKTEPCTPNDEYENFVNAHLEAAAKYIPIKHRTKSRVPWEILAVREKRADAKTASKCNRKNPTNTNALKLKTVQNELANIYLKEQKEYIQNQIDKIRDSVKDRQSRIAW